MDFGRWVPTQIDGFGSDAATGVPVGSYPVVWFLPIAFDSVICFTGPSGDANGSSRGGESELTSGSGVSSPRSVERDGGRDE